MDIFIRTAGGVLIAVILYLILQKQGKDMSVLLTLSVCCIVTVAAVTYLEPVFAFLERLRNTANLDGEMLGTIVKAVGVGVISQIVENLCQDAGNAAMGKTVQILSSGVILWLSVPLFTSLFDLVEEILVTL